MLERIEIEVFNLVFEGNNYFTKLRDSHIWDSLYYFFFRIRNFIDQQKAIKNAHEVQMKEATPTKN